MSDPLGIDVFWSFRSPWSYLATPRLADWAKRYVLDVRFRPVYPIAIRTPEFFASVPPQWFSYLMTDVFRVAEFLELPFVWPSPDPVVSEPNSEGRPGFPDEQPYIHRLTRLGVLAEERGQGIQFANEVSGLLWGGARGWDEGRQLADATARAGLDLAELDPIAEAEAERLTAVIEKNQDDHAAAGHWGVPTCVFSGEPFFGQDRLDVLLWRLKKAGLQER
jgi:2-hydroxychromene-2-carboxylate isomerase